MTHRERLDALVEEIEWLTDEIIVIGDEIVHAVDHDPHSVADLQDDLWALMERRDELEDQAEVIRQILLSQ